MKEGGRRGGGRKGGGRKGGGRKGGGRKGGGRKGGGRKGGGRKGGGRKGEEGREGGTGNGMGQAPSLFVGGGAGLSLSMPSPSFVRARCVHTRCCCWEGGFVVDARCCAWVWCGGLVMVVWSSLAGAVVVGGHGMSAGIVVSLSLFAVVLCDDER
jgi:hypothetical protein